MTDVCVCTMRAQKAALLMTLKVPHREWEAWVDLYRWREVSEAPGLSTLTKNLQFRDSSTGSHKTDSCYKNTVLNFATELEEIYK